MVEEDIRDIGDAVAALPLTMFSGNSQATIGRRGAMASQLQIAASLVAAGSIQDAIDKLESILAKIDGDPSPPDWIADDADGDTTKADLRDLIQLQIDILTYLL